MSPEGLILIVPSDRKLSPGEVEKEMTEGLKKILKDMRQRRKNDELISQLIKQNQEYCDRNIWQQQKIDQLQQENTRQREIIDQLQRRISEVHPLMLGNARLSHENQELLAKNAWLEEQLQKSKEFFPKLIGRRK
jgi:protease II